jgi:hypothetical protein
MGQNRELWRAIKGAPGYKVSRKGRVHSKNQVLKPFDDRRGYLRVMIKGYNKKIHLLVADAFLPADPDKPIVNHIDGNKHNNRLDNLEHCTLSENTKHAWALGLCNRR